MDTLVTSSKLFTAEKLTVQTKLYLKRRHCSRKGNGFSPGSLEHVLTALQGGRFPLLYPGPLGRLGLCRARAGGCLS